MADKRSNISDLLMYRRSNLVIPQFLHEKGKCSRRNGTTTSNMAKPRIYCECATAQIKIFRILQTVFPLTLQDQLDKNFINCAAIINQTPALVPIITFFKYS